MSLHLRQGHQLSLISAVVVVVKIILYSLNQGFAVMILSSVIHFPLDNALESFHRSVVNTMGDPRHALGHSGVNQLLMEYPACILEASVGMKEWMRIWVGGSSRIKCAEH